MEQKKRGLDLQASQIIFELDTSGSVFLELASAFHAQLKEQMLKLKSFHATKDFEKMRAVSHMLKSSAVYLGAKQMSELCRKLESLSGAHHEDSFKCVEEVLKESLSVDLLLAAEISRIQAKAS